MLGTILTILALPLLLLIKGFFSGSEIALVNADKIHLQHLEREGHRGARLALRLLKKPELLLSTALIGTNIATVTLVTIGTGAAIRLAGEGADAYAVFILAPLLLIFGEVVPKSIYQQKADSLAPRIIYPLWSLSLLLSPLTYAFSTVARFVARRSGVEDARPAVLVTKNMIRSVVRMADRASGLESFARDRIQRATRFSLQRAGELLLPISEVPCLPASATTAAAIAIVREHGIYRVPLYDGSTREVVAVATLSPWELLDRVDTEAPLLERSVAPLFVVETQRVSDLVPVLRQRADRMAVVVGDRGQTLGVVTLEEILAGVSGPMDAGFHSAPRGERELLGIRADSDDTFFLGGRVPLARLAEVLESDVPAGASYTIGGLINERLARVATVGDRVKLDEWTLEVVEASASEVLKVRVYRSARSRSESP